MSQVEFYDEVAGLASFVIEGEEYSEDGESAVVPVAVLKRTDIASIPYDFDIEICESQSDAAVVIKIPAHFKRIGEKKFHVWYEELITRKYWDGVVGLKLLMETKKGIIEERSREIGDISLDYYDDDGAYICLKYCTNIIADSIDNPLMDIEQLYGEIEGATDIALGSPFQQIDDCEKESEFTIKILLPLFRKLGFVNVKYNHGNKEFGKDVTFARRTEFDEYEYYGVQVKFGDVSGGANGDINELITQAKDAFSMPFYDVYSRNKVRISKVIIAISGKFTLNAVEKIIEGIQEYPLKNNLIFLDGEKIESLMSKYSVSALS